jgi:class 3 adenylate cyclase
MAMAIALLDCLVRAVLFLGLGLEPRDDVLGRLGRGDGDAVGLDTGKVNLGEFGRTHQDLTAIGTVVNVASRA